MTMTALGERLSGWLVGRWSRILLAVLAGAGAALAHPPFGLLPGLLGYPLLILLCDRANSVRGAVWMGWLAGFAYFLVSCWWVAEAFFVNPAQIWMAPFAVSLLPAGLALFWALATGLYRRFNRGDATRVLLFAALFCLTEWLRGHVLTGFPWNPAGASWGAGSAISQTASVVGIYGLSLITVGAVSTVAVLADTCHRRHRLGWITAGLAVLCAVALWGGLRLQTAEVVFSDTRVRIVQANIDQESKWSPETYRQIVQRYVELTRQPSEDGEPPDFVIWPEGALPAALEQVFAPGAAEGQAIAQALAPDQTLLAGFSRSQFDPSSEGGVRYANSLVALRDIGDAGLQIVAIYDKHRLVPFGEFLPGGAFLGTLGVRSLTHMPADFSPGPRPSPITLEDGNDRPWVIQPLICYEGLYPGLARTNAGRPQWIVNVSNDAWFGPTSGPLQHLNLASFRAIETGLPVVRATPTGVSTIVDSWGRTVPNKRLDVGQAGVIDANLPLSVSPTLYARFSDLFFVILSILGLTAGRLRGRVRSQKGPATVGPQVG